MLLVLTLVVSLSALFVYYIYAIDTPMITGSVIRNVEYKPGLKLDIYNPTKHMYDKTPVVLYIHGGAWIAGMKEGLNFNRFNQAVSGLREAGYAIVSIDYTLAHSNQGPFPACIDDAVDAVTWIHLHSADHNFDVNNLGLFGESAGAHIAMMVAYGRPALYFKDQPDVHFNYVIDIYGPNRLNEIYHAPTITAVYSTLGKFPAGIQTHLDFPRYIFGFDPRRDSLRAAKIMDKYSPYRYLSSSAPPTLLIQGDADRVVPLAQSVSLQAKLDSLGVENEIHVVEGADHAFANATAEQKSKLQQQIVEFILRHYSK